MAGGFVKVYEEIMRSSVWLEDHSTRIVWITMLVAAGPDGIVRASHGGLAHTANVTRDECEAALATLLAPDSDSRSKEHEGRRIEEVDGGWLVLNHGKYRERQTERNAQAAERMRKHRERKRNQRNAMRNGANGDAGSHQRQKAEAEAEAEAEESVPPPSESPKRRPTRASSPEAIEIAQYLYDAILSHTPTFMADAKPAAIASKLGGWARDIDVGLRNDGMTLDGCRLAIDAAHRSEDDFWRSNLLSGTKLRKHYEKLKIRGAKTTDSLPPGFDFHAFGEKWDEACGIKK